MVAGLHPFNRKKCLSHTPILFIELLIFWCLWGVVTDTATQTQRTCGTLQPLQEEQGRNESHELRRQSSYALFPHPRLQRPVRWLRPSIDPCGSIEAPRPRQQTVCSGTPFLVAEHVSRNPCL
jgi:hypothetical protein